MIQLNTYNQIQEIYKYLRKQRENERFINYIEIAATFTFISLFLFLAIRPTAAAIFTLLGEIKSKEALTLQMKTKINSVIRAQDSYSRIQEKYDVISSSLPDRPKFYQAASNFASISQKSNASINKISFGLSGENKPSEDIRNYSVNLSGKNLYGSTLDFVYKILNSRRLIDMEGIQLTKFNDKENVNSNAINVNFNTQLFYLQDNHAKN